MILLITSVNWSGCSLSIIGVTLGILCLAIVPPKSLAKPIPKSPTLSVLRVYDVCFLAGFGVRDAGERLECILEELDLAEGADGATSFGNPKADASNA